jgi:eukaryotic translation initiation factor 2C
MQVIPRLITVPGRVLTGPEVKYKNSAARAAFGSWNMQPTGQSGKPQQFSITTAISSWTYLYLPSQRQPNAWNNDQELNATLDAFQSKLRQLGIQVSSYTPGLRVGLPDSDKNSNHDELIDNTIHKFTVHPTRPPPSLLFVILPYVDDPIYNRIKWLCDVKYGLRNICVLGSKFAKERNDQYFANVALKVNLKFGGRNQSLEPSKIGIIAEGKTMVVGMDVTHPSPGSSSQAPSVASIVASVDQWLGQWPADLRIQKSRQEMVADLDGMLKSRLRLWAMKNQKRYPENILVYRDGVSEGQYDLVLSEELPLLRKACQETYPADLTKKGLPRMTIIIVGKRHNTRFFVTRPEDADRSSNTPSGTVVDRGVTEAPYWDFYMQAHTALQGTARPAHYYVVLDEIFQAHPVKTPFKHAADVLEDLTHNMCYLYGRATKAVSICPAAYYADLVCERGRKYLSRLFDASPGATPAGSVIQGVGGGGGQAPGADPSEVRLHPNVGDSMFYL